MRFALDATGDIALARNAKGKLSPVKVTDPALCAALKIFVRLNFYLGEWFLDTRQGAPYINYVYGVKNPDMMVVRNIYRRIVMSVSSVLSCSVTTNYVSKQRKCYVDFQAKTDKGAIIQGGIGAPYIVNGKPVFNATLNSLNDALNQ